MGKVTEKDTKKVILEELRITEEALADAVKTSADPTKALELKRGIDVVANADEIAGTIDGVFGLFEQAVDKFKVITSAIAQQESKLKDLFGIEAGAFTLMALEDTHAKRVAALEADYSEKKLDFYTRQQARIAEDAERVSTQKRDRERANEQYDYDRKIQVRNDKAQAKQEIEGMYEDVEAAQAELKDREQRLKLEQSELGAARVDLVEREDGLKKEIDKAVAIATSAQKSKYEAQTALAAANHDGEVNLLKASVAALETRNDDSAARIADLEQKLSDAYSANSDLATASVTGAANQKLVEDLMSKVGNETTGKR